VARPFRLQPPAPPARAVARPRLAALLDERWTRRLVTIVAGPGFGKTTLLSTMLASTRAGRDVWLSCEPSDHDAFRLVDGLREAIGLPPPADLAAILDHVWSVAPQPVCFVLDDVHEIDRATDGAGVLRQLVDDLPANGHVLLASRDVVPVPTARLAAAGQLTRIREEDLLLDDAEIEAFAASHGVSPTVLASCGRWPALAELAASAGADLVVDYLWEEVLARIGPERSRWLAMLAVAGGGDDEIASALAGIPLRVDDVVAGVPLVIRGRDGWAALHPLWGPPLRQVVTEEEADDARRRAAAAHRAAHRLEAAADLLIEAQDWPGVVAVVHDAIVSGSNFGALIAWGRALPPDDRDSAEALFVEAIDIRSRVPAKSLQMFTDAAAAFRAAGDVDGELAAMQNEALARWWANDFTGLFPLFGRLSELASDGSRRAEALDAVGRAAVANVIGDSAQVFAHLERAADQIPPEWQHAVTWLLSVSHRRNGDLAKAYEALAPYADKPITVETQAGIARLRTDWLRGDVDHVRRMLPEACACYDGKDRYLFVESSLELASKLAWLGDIDEARAILATITPEDMPGVVTRVLYLIGHAAVAIGDGDEAAAATMIRESRDSPPGRPESWYWRDRGALALPFVLVPESREGWRAEPLGPAHLPGLALAEAFAALRDGDKNGVRDLAWPEAGIVRAHLPRSWAVELAAAAHAAGNPPPTDLLPAIGSEARTDLRQLIDRAPARETSAAAKRLLATVPSAPKYVLRLGVLGPLQLWRDGETVTHPHLRRQRVREVLCVLAARRRIRREELADELWPDVAEPAGNLRTTLAYVQQVLQPDRADGEPPFFLRPEGAWLTLDRLEVDAWDLEARLDEGDQADETNNPAAALAAYRSALDLWRGEPYQDVAEGMWVVATRTRLRTRYSAAAVRAGELALAAGDPAGAVSAAHAAIGAEPDAEPAYQLLIRAHLSEGNVAAATHAVEQCRAALAELGLEPDGATIALVAERVPG
jgi:DNA-binding SARP family transcriptional activator